MAPSECTVSGANIIGLDGSGYNEIDKRTEGNINVSSYVRNASNVHVPAKLEVFWNWYVQFWNLTTTKVVISTIQTDWALYYQTEPTEATKTKTVTFVCGTKFSSDDPFTNITVSDCPIGNGGLNGEYTKGTTGDTYTRTQADKLKSSITCKWASKTFTIAVLAEKHELGFFTPSNNYTVLTANTTDKKLSITLTPKTECKYVPFGTIVSKPSSGNTYTASCYTGSAQRAGASTWSAECQNGKLNIQEPCKPGPTQKYIIVSDFRGSLDPFNGAYVYDTLSGQPGQQVTWRNTKASVSTRIVVSDALADILELRDTSSSVNYCIKITVGSPISLSCVKNTSTFNDKADFKAKFSATSEGKDPCEDWSTCISTHSNEPSNCAIYASSCSPTASTNQEFTFYQLRTSPSVTTGINLYPMGKGDGGMARYGRGPGTSPSDATTLYVVVAVGELKDGKKGKVLVIPQTATNATVRDATLRIVLMTNTWTIDSQAATETEKQLPGTNDKKTPETTDKKTPETATEPQCVDLVECAKTATTLSFSSCAVQAVACESKRPKDLGQTDSPDSLTHGDEKGIKLYTLTSDVLYGTDAVNAYVVLVRKEKVLVAPRDNKTDATVLDVTKEGTVWTSKRDNTMMWIIIVSVFGGLLAIVLVALFVFAMRSDDRGRMSPLRYSYTDQGYDSSYAVPIPGPHPTTTASTTTTPAQGPKP